MHIIENIKREMSEQNITQTELAQKSGLSFGTLNRILNNKQPLKPNSLHKIADALNISTWELEEVNDYTILNHQVNGYLEFNGEIKRIKSFKELESWVKRVKPLINQLPQQAKAIIKANEKNSKKIKSNLNKEYDFNITNFNQIESYDATQYDCWAFKGSNDIRDGIAIPLGNQCGGFPFTLHGHNFYTSESSYLCGQFSNNTAKHFEIQQQLLMEQNGYLAKKKIKRWNADAVRGDWEEFRVEWMFYVIWHKCKNNVDFQDILLSIPHNAIIIENSTTIYEDTSDIWGAKNKELEDARNIIEKYIQFQNPYMKKKELDLLVVEEKNKINHIGTFANGRNCMGKILKLCQLALLNNAEPLINYELLKEKQIYLLGELLKF